MTSSKLLACALSVTLLCTGTAQAQLYKDPTQSVEVRTQDLLSRMTLEEKVAQMICVWQTKSEFLDSEGNLKPAKLKKEHPNGIGCIARPQDTVGIGDVQDTPARDAKQSVSVINDIQKASINDTRLGIPVLFHEEGLHGFQAKDATSFPQAIGLASTWNEALLRDVYSVVAREIRARGVHHVLSPVVDVARDPRWGRIEETFGEDPYLVSRMGVAAIKGFQGQSRTLEKDKVFTTLKHMTGHGQPEAGTNVAPANISERILREIFFPPFEAAVREAKAASVMASYNEIDGVPSHASKFLLKEVLRGEWEFDGLVVSDYYAIDQLNVLHNVAANDQEAAILAGQAGVDMELPDPDVYPILVELVEKGLYPMSAIDESVARILTLKFNAGLFENAYADAEYAEQITGNAEARALALKAAEQSMVLLKNSDNTLPLNVDAIKRLAVIGPNADNVVLGGYSDQPRQTVSILEGVRSHVKDNIEVVYAEGARITEDPGWKSWFRHDVVFADRKENLVRIKEAVELAKTSDAIVLAIGGNEATSREAFQDDHLGDRADINLVGEQQELFDELHATGKPIVVVLISGRPLAVNEIASKADALIQGWLLGQETGTAVTKALFGEISPSGKLPVSIPRSVGHLPVYYNYKPSAKRGYVDNQTGALYPFGYGLSYTQFSLSKPRLSASTIKPYGKVVVSTKLKNTGDRNGAEVVQLYIRDVVSSVTRPVKELKAFKRVELEPGETTKVEFELDAQRDLAFFDINMEKTVEAGEYEIMIGNSSENLQTVTLNVSAGKTKR